MNISILTVRGSESDVYRRQILTSKVDPRALRVKFTLITLKYCEWTMETKGLFLF